MRRQPTANERLFDAIKDRLAEGPPPPRSPVQPAERLAVARQRRDLAGAIRARLAEADAARAPARAAVTRAAKRDRLEAWAAGLSDEQKLAASDPSWLAANGGADPELLAEVLEASATVGMALSEAQLRAAIEDYAVDEGDYSSPYLDDFCEEGDGDFDGDEAA
jgi:hypothetical protein